MGEEKDYWPKMLSDDYAEKRIAKSVKSANVGISCRILDVGCHQEELKNFLPKCHYIGLDIIKGDNFDGGFKVYQKFDRIFCLEVLEHLKNPEGTLLSIFESLEDDGICVISLPNEASIFHRIRCLLGTVDAQAFYGGGKHLHLPSLNQSRKFLGKLFQIENTAYYISPSAKGSNQEWAGKILRLIPDSIHQFLADRIPSLFARGFIFVCKKK